MKVPARAPPLSAGDRIDTGPVARHHAGIQCVVADCVRDRAHIDVAILVTERVVEPLRKPVARQRRLSDDKLGFVVDIHLVVDPVEQRGTVLKARAIHRIRAVLPRRARLGRELDSVAERVVVHAVAHARLSRARITEPHPRGARVVRHHADAAVRAAEAAEGEELAVRVLRRVVHVAGRARVAHPDVQVGRLAADGQVVVDVGRDAGRLRAPPQAASRSGVADQTTVEVPVVLQAVLAWRRSRPCQRSRCRTPSGPGVRS